MLISTRMVNLFEQMDDQQENVVKIKALLKYLRKLDGMEPSAFEIFRNLILQLKNLKNDSPEQLILWNRIKEQIECSGNIYFGHYTILDSLKKKCNEIAKEQGDEFKDLLKKFESINTDRMSEIYLGERLSIQDGNYAGMMGWHENDVDNNRGNYGVGYVVRDYKWLPPFEQESDVDKIISTWRSERDCYRQECFESSF